MGALDEDIQLIHFIDKHDPDRESLATALKLAIQYEQEHGLSPELTSPRIDVKQVADDTTVSAYGQDTSPLIQQVEHTSKSLETITSMVDKLKQLAQDLRLVGRRNNKKTSGPCQIWPGSNYQGRNFILNYRRPASQQCDSRQECQQVKSTQNGDDSNNNGRQPENTAAPTNHQTAATPSQQTTANAVQPTAPQSSA